MNISVPSEVLVSLFTNKMSKCHSRVVNKTLHSGVNYGNSLDDSCCIEIKCTKPRLSYFKCRLQIYTILYVSY